MGRSRVNRRNRRDRIKANYATGFNAGVASVEPPSPDAVLVSAIGDISDGELVLDFNADFDPVSPVFNNQVFNITNNGTPVVVTGWSDTETYQLTLSISTLLTVGLLTITPGTHAGDLTFAGGVTWNELDFAGGVRP